MAFTRWRRYVQSVAVKMETRLVLVEKTGAITFVFQKEVIKKQNPSTQYSFHKSFKFIAGMPAGCYSCFVFGRQHWVWGVFCVKYYCSAEPKKKKPFATNLDPAAQSHGSLINVRSAVDGLMIRPGHKGGREQGGVGGRVRLLQLIQVMFSHWLNSLGWQELSPRVFFFFIPYVPLRNYLMPILVCGSQPHLNIERRRLMYPDFRRRSTRRLRNETSRLFKLQCKYCGGDAYDFEPWCVGLS